MHFVEIVSKPVYGSMRWWIVSIITVIIHKTFQFYIYIAKWWNYCQHFYFFKTFTPHEIFTYIFYNVISFKTYFFIVKKNSVFEQFGLLSTLLVHGLQLAYHGLLCVVVERVPAYTHDHLVDRPIIHLCPAVVHSRLHSVWQRIHNLYRIVRWKTIRLEYSTVYNLATNLGW